MTRYRITVEYDGGPFVGWQRQDNGPSVQAALEEAIQAFCGEAVTVTGAGRTDSGVHALAQVAHFDLAGAPGPATVRDAVNFHLTPAPVAVLAAEAVAVPPGAAPGTVLDGAPTVACAEGGLRLLALQRAGRKPQGAAAFLRGFPLPAGTRLALPAEGAGAAP